MSFSPALSTQARAEVLSSPAQAADAAYRYRILLVQAGPAQLLVQCWRRSPEAAWQPHCGPTPMDLFIRRFLPPAQLAPSNSV
ncbi:hypothetical protein [Cyanobium sp. LEGE 06113]|uniref:hypothetical protein n=1 Tax=Cyanobium sp. LEGE 06113 TaxID=1297573 RepID=UPI00187E1C7D|nr:hypothetical protein [Cyanobium sp. LEGE 06113]MBE9153367.1 hypothetical protein [Cyanobium sp. LEGE 06113]